MPSGKADVITDTRGGLTGMRIINLIENTEGSAGCVYAHGLSKLSMGEQLQYVHLNSTIS